jgi:PAS domain S-box-containing protein
VPAKTQAARIGVFLASVAVYIVLFVVLYPKIGRAGGSLLTLPILVATVCLGGTTALSFAVLSFFLNTAIMRVLGHPEPLFTASRLSMFANTLGFALFFVAARGWLVLKRETQLRRNAEERFQASEARFRSIVEKVSEAIVVVDAEGRIDYASPRTAAVLGMESSELPGKHISRFVPQREKNRLTSAWQEARSSTTPEFHVYIEDAHGDRHWTSVQLSEFEGDKTLVVVRDTSEERRIIRRLRRARRREEAAQERQRAFFAGVSHDLRSPVSTVLQMSRELLTGDLPVEQREPAEVIADSAETMLDLTSSLLELARLKDGRLPLTTRSFNLGDLLRKRLRFLEPTAEEKGLELLSTLDLSVEREFESDPVRLGQVLHNLIGNAVKYTDSGNVRLAASVVRTPRTPRTPMLKLEVRDSGPGIAEELLPHVFEPFTRGSQDRHGSGLGLSVVQSIVTRMDGTIDVESVTGSGTTFRVSLPLNLPSAPGQSKPRSASRHLPVLIADDDRVSRLYATRILEDEGFEVITAEDGGAALEACERTAFGALVLDVRMPGIEGPEVARTVRTSTNLQTASETIIVLLTAGVDDIGSDTDFDCVLTKPVSREELIACLHQACATQPPDRGIADRT